MENRGAYLRVGALVVLATAVLVGLVLFFGGKRISSGRAFESYFGETVQGLEVGAAVKYRGVTLGQVTEISLVSATYGEEIPEAQRNKLFRQVMVRYLIDVAKIGHAADVDEIITQGLRSRLASAGLTGLTYIELDFVSGQRFPATDIPWRPRLSNIPSMPSTLAQVQDSAQALLQKIDKVDIAALSEGLIGLITDVRGELRQGDLHESLSQTRSLLTTLESQIKQANLPALTAELRDTAAAYRGLAQGKPVTDMIANAGAATQKLTTAIAQLPGLVESIEKLSRRVTASTSDVQADLTPVLRDMRAALSNLRDTTEQLRRDPAQLLFSQPPARTGR